jgi:copper(I)-binding protein
MKLKSLAAALLLGLLAPSAWANLTINLPWVRPSTDGRTAEVYMQISSLEAAALVGASSFAAAGVTLKGPGKQGKSVKEIALPPGAAVDLMPGGYRIALTRLTRPLKLGEHVPITLNFRYADGRMQETLVNADVRQRSAIEDEGQPHTH